MCNQNNKRLYKHRDQSLLSMLTLLSNSYMQRAMNKVLLWSVIWVRFLIWGTKYACHINCDGLFLPANQDWLKNGQRYVLCTIGSSRNFNWRCFWKRELTTSSAEYSITNKQNNGPKRIKSFQILFTKIGNDVVHLTRNTSLPHGRQESLNHSLMFELLCNLISPHLRAGSEGLLIMICVLKTIFLFLLQPGYNVMTIKSRKAFSFGRYSGFQVTWMIEWGQKSKPKKIPRASNNPPPPPPPQKKMNK